MARTILLFLSLFAGFTVFPQPSAPDEPKRNDLLLVSTIKGNILPKSVVYVGKGRFFAQNMMYRHSITVYDRNFRLLKTIADEVQLSDFGYSQYQGSFKGAPVEAAATADEKYVYVSNYYMEGEGFDNPGEDNCDRHKTHDQSFLYRINLSSLQIDQAIQVGSVPKYVATTPDGRYVLVSNWCSGDLSIISQKNGKEIERIPLGNFPRGITVDASGRYAYISIMGDDRIAILRLKDFQLTWINGLERTPRHLCIDPTSRYLYVTLSRPGKVIKIDLIKKEVIQEAKTGKEARSMAISPCGRYLYVVNYKDNTLSKVETHNMRVIQTVATGEKPIGVTFDPETGRVWVACYTGKIMVFEDQRYVPLRPLAQVVDVPQSGSSIMRMPGLPQQNKQDPHYFVRKHDPVPGSPIPQNPTPSPIVEVEELPVVAQATPSLGQSRGTAPDPVSAEPETQDKRFLIIIGSFASYAPAKHKLNELQAKGYSPELVRGQGGRYRVACISTASRNEAENALSRIRKQISADAWILSR